MDSIVDIAKYLIDRYKMVSKEDDIIDEMKLHKLLYFAQRESFAINNEPLFLGKFEGWKYGPVSRDVRTYYKDLKSGILIETKEISETSKYIINNIVEEYGAMAAWKLSDLSHKEKSWLNSREGLSEGENGDIELKLEDIKLDSEKVRPYDYMWDMYYDEFEDYVEGDEY